jgi:nitroreductase
LTVPPAPQFGKPIAAQASPAVLEFLARRRSASAMALAAPGPSADQLADLLRLAARVPDHGKINPWRFIVIQDQAKTDFADWLNALAQGRPDANKAVAALGKLRTPPLAVAVVSSPVQGNIPLWEQQLSAGAVCMALLMAATAMGFGANWITDWYAFDPSARAHLALSPDEQIAGFLYIGTATDAPQERVRPVMDALITAWKP